ncbi:hypothetical protein GCK72_008917 [Caenorhabditis remanei]|uniref:Uncharacterized protein n=1 Tax=Caenorhabditis remanei TaxID=31234 RepID=A0A6A5GYW1_CAERE|nr:hypothetical protein GCK72_008917 [Caenorhabditis remanei]KAF1760668.1 hypothetical protein GCK72_008917 [Caenorhabditis remanei]
MTSSNPTKYPEKTPKKFPSSIILDDLLFLVSTSVSRKEAVKCARRIIHNLEQCQKWRDISSDEISELREIENYLLAVKNYYRIRGDEARVRLFTAKNAVFMNWIMLSVGTVAFSVYSHHYGFPTSYQLFLALLFLVVLAWIVKAFSYLECLRFVVPTPKEESNVRNEGKWMKLKDTPTHSSLILKREQLALFDLSEEEVFPVKNEFDRLETELKETKLHRAAPTYLIIFICLLCFLIRSCGESNLTEHISCFILTLVGITPAFFPLFFK